jgi:hypothetical protein
MYKFELEYYMQYFKEKKCSMYIADLRKFEVRKSQKNWVRKSQVR